MPYVPREGSAHWAEVTVQHSRGSLALPTILPQHPQDADMAQPGQHLWSVLATPAWSWEQGGRTQHSPSFFL